MNYGKEVKKREVPRFAFSCERPHVHECDDNCRFPAVLAKFREKYPVKTMGHHHYVRVRYLEDFIEDALNYKPTKEV